MKELCQDLGYDYLDTGDKVICHHYTQSDIASLIGTSRPTLNILLNELKDENYLDFYRKEIRILNKSV
ncbi:helix-turn-helix domain-containing protein [Winogradskyella costae]|uniref:helix-turn-helix domain-containing protein n=1 Tax=Winogradskyella costae TaxID=2697008 RepID=UPI00293BEEF6|nr:helix-turn-helix domain-containing protein [Winogradskyella costae]